VRAPPVPLRAPPHHEEPGLAGVVHVVRRGETIYRIARAYGIDAADLLETNGIDDPRALAVGTELFVPGATRVVEIEASGNAGASQSPTANATSTPNANATATPSATASATPTRSTNPSAAAPGADPTARSAGASPAPVARPSRAGRPSLSWPLKGVLYGRYGVRGGERHDGIDIAAPEGAPVVAAADGTVLYAGEQPGYGAIVILEHEGGLVTLYAHNSRVLVREGARVRRGEAIARVGQTGRTTGPHLHFEVREGTRPRNPLLFLP
jgi:murein DD-endopeptidase MepM/ murein hydrolase activator NlpD